MSSALDHHLEPIKHLLNDDEITEICLCGAHHVYYEGNNGWNYLNEPSFTDDTLFSITNQIATATNQQISKEAPVLSAFLSTGERVQIVREPACLFTSITIRRPSKLIFNLTDFEKMGAFEKAEIARTDKISNIDQKLLDFLQEKNFKDFFSLAVKSKKNIVVSGATGSGKTTFMKGLILEIPENERIITIEDVPELYVPHQNCARLLYSKDDQGSSKVTVKKLLESCLRMRPDRILLAELRGEEAFYFIRNVNSGHPGSITSIHANSCEMAFDQLMLYVKESAAGRNLDRSEIITLLHLLIDVVVQYTRDKNGKRVVSEVYFDPHAKLALSQQK